MTFIFLIDFVIRFVACGMLITSFLGINWTQSLRAEKVERYQLKFICTETGRAYKASRGGFQTYVTKFWR